MKIFFSFLATIGSFVMYMTIGVSMINIYAPTPAFTAAEKCLYLKLGGHHEDGPLAVALEETMTCDYGTTKQKMLSRLVETVQEIDKSTDQSKASQFSEVMQP
jgi:hypothetical protein